MAITVRRTGWPDPRTSPSPFRGLAATPRQLDRKAPPTRGLFKPLAAAMGPPKPFAPHAQMPLAPAPIPIETLMPRFALPPAPPPGPSGLTPPTPPLTMPGADQEAATKPAEQQRKRAAVGSLLTRPHGGDRF